MYISDKTKFKGTVFSFFISVMLLIVVYYKIGGFKRDFIDGVFWVLIFSAIATPLLTLFVYPIMQMKEDRKEREREKREEREREEREMLLRIREKEELTRIDTDAILTVAREKDRLDREKLILIQTLENQLATARQQDIADIEAQIRRLKNGL